MGKMVLSRRSFVKASAVTAAALGLSAGGSSSVFAETTEQPGSDDIQRIRSGCRGCGKMECGVWVTVQNGRVIKTEGDESAFQSAGSHCSKGQASVQAAYHPARLTYPLKRTNPKGQDPGWQRITWDEAYQLTADGIHANQEKYGNETFIGMVGTSRVWAMAGYQIMSMCFGSPNMIQAYQICKGPRHWAARIDASSNYSWMETVGHPRVYVQWGGASELSNYDDSCRTTVDVATRAESHILVDPRQTSLGKEADIWVNLRPGTDGAVANCWAQVIIENNLYDDFYVRKWMNAPMLLVEEESFEPTPSSASWQSKKIVTRLLKESDLVEGGADTRFMVINELNDELSWYDAGGDNPGWEGEDWVPATEGRVSHQPGLDATGQAQGFVLDYTPFPEGLLPALHTESVGRAVTLKDGTVVHVRTVWERYIDFLEDFTPEKVEAISGVKAETLIKAATTYATRVDPTTGYGNGGIHYMLALEHACNCIQSNRGTGMLAGITGNMDIPGGMRGASAGWPLMDVMVLMSTSKDTVPYTREKVLGCERFIMLGSDVSPIWADATSIYDAIESGDPYKVSCGIGQAGDFMNHSNSIFAVEQLCKLDFWCSIDLWQTPCVDLAADVAMPAAHWLELDCMRKSQGSSGAFGATVKCIEPPGEAKSDLEINMGIYKAAGVPFRDGDTDDEKWPLHDFARVCNNFALRGFRIPDWEDYKKEFQEKGWFDSKIECPQNWGTYRRYQIGNGHVTGGFPSVQKQHQGWNTTTNKQEIWSTVFESWLPGQGEEFPKFVEAPHGPVADPDLFTADNSFTLITGRRQPTYFHSEHRQLPWCRELWPVPRLEMNPFDAKRLDLEQGDWVWIETKEHKIREVVDLYYGIAPGVVNAEHQWWYPELEQSDHGYKLSGVNCLIDRHAQDRIVGASNLRVYGVTIYKATPENSPFGNPIPCGDDGTPIISSCDDPRLKAWLPAYEGRE